MVFNEEYSRQFDAVLSIKTIAVRAPSVGGLDIISAKVRPRRHVTYAVSWEGLCTQHCCHSVHNAVCQQSSNLLCLLLTHHVAAAASTGQALAPAAPHGLDSEVSLVLLRGQNGLAKAGCTGSLKAWTVQDQKLTMLLLAGEPARSMKVGAGTTTYSVAILTTAYHWRI